MNEKQIITKGERKTNIFDNGIRRNKERPLFLTPARNECKKKKSHEKCVSI